MTTESPQNFDELFATLEGDVTPDAGTPAPEQDEPTSLPLDEPTRDHLTPEQRRIQELEAALAAPLPSFEETTVEAEPTPEQLRIKELEDKLARRNAMVAEQSPSVYSQPAGEGDHIVLHVLEDGFMALGEVWYRGQEMEFVVGSPAYEQTKDRNGNTWIDLALDPAEQMRVWGRLRIGQGPFIPRRGEVFNDELSTSDVRRGRAVPLIR